MVLTAGVAHLIGAAFQRRRGGTNRRGSQTIDQVAQRLATGKLAIGQDTVALILQGGDQGQEVVRRDLEVVETIASAWAIGFAIDETGR